MNKFKRLLSAATAAALSLSAFAGLTISAGAETTVAVPLVDYEAENATVLFSSGVRFHNEIVTSAKGTNTSKVENLACYGQNANKGYAKYLPISASDAKDKIVTFEFDLYQEARTTYLSLGSGGSGDGRNDSGTGRALQIKYTDTDGKTYANSAQIGTSDKWVHIVADANNSLKTVEWKSYDYATNGDYSEATPIFSGNSAYLDSSIDVLGMDFYGPNRVDTGIFIDNVKISLSDSGVVPCNVTYDVNGKETSEIVVSGNTVTSIPDTTYYGYNFDGWSQDGSSTLISTDDLQKLAITADTKFTAKYSDNTDIKKYTVIFDVNGTETTEVFMGEKDTDVKIPADKIPYTFRTGYVFDGWHEDGAEEGKNITTAALQEQVLSKNTKFTAQYHELELGSGTKTDPFVNYDFSGDTASNNKVIGYSSTQTAYSADSWMTYHVACASDKDSGAISVKHDSAHGNYAEVRAGQQADADHATNHRAPIITINKVPSLAGLSTGNYMYFTFDFAYTTAEASWKCTLYLNDGTDNSPSGDFIKINLEEKLESNKWYTAVIELDPSTSSVKAVILDADGNEAYTQQGTYSAKGDPSCLRFLGTNASKTSFYYKIDNIKIYQAPPALESTNAVIYDAETGKDGTDDYYAGYNDAAEPTDEYKLKVATPVMAEFKATAAYSHPKVNWTVTYNASAADEDTGKTRRTKDISYPDVSVAADSTVKFGAVFTGINLKKYDYQNTPSITAILSEGEAAATD